MKGFLVCLLATAVNMAIIGLVAAFAFGTWVYVLKRRQRREWERSR